MDRTGDRPVRAGAVCLWDGRVAWVYVWQLRARQGRRGGVDAVVRAGRVTEGRGKDAAREARRPVLAAWRARGADGFCADAGQRGDGPDDGSDGGVSGGAAQ